MGDDSFFFDQSADPTQTLTARSLSFVDSAGTDSVVIGEDLSLSGGLSIAAESITLSAGFTLSTGAGNVALTASARDASQVTDASQLAARAASVQVLGNIAATSGNVTITAEAMRNVAVSNLVLPLILASSSTATAVISGNVTTSGTLSVTASTTGSVSGTSSLIALSSPNRKSS